jgi:hypothetical protein
LEDLKETRRYWTLEEEALSRALKEATDLLQNRIRGDGDDYGFRLCALSLDEMRTLVYVSKATKDGTAGRFYQRTRNVINH